MTSNHLPEWQQHTPVIKKTIEIPLRSDSNVRITRNIRQLTLSVTSSKASINPREKNKKLDLTRMQVINSILPHDEQICHLYLWQSFTSMTFSFSPSLTLWLWTDLANINFRHVYRIIYYIYSASLHLCGLQLFSINDRRGVLEGDSGRKTQLVLSPMVHLAVEETKGHIVVLLECFCSSISEIDVFNATQT